jgi:hypothetical protein
MKNTFALVLSLISFIGWSQTDINNARTGYSIGQTVTIRGVVTNGAELGSIRYIQDQTGALPAYGGILSSVQRGDSITATGVLYDYNGLLELSPTNSFSPQGTGTLPTPLLLTIPNVGELYEAQLVKFENVTFTTSGTFAASTNYTISDGSNSLTVRTSTSASSLVGTPIPTGAVSVTGLLGQFNTFQLLPRDINDIEAYVAPDKEINILMDGLTVMSGNTFNVGNASSVSVTIENTGTGPLAVSGASLSGTNSADFSSDIVGSAINGGSSAVYTLSFTPSGNGTRTATLDIVSDDSDENPYTIYLTAYGLDGLADEPTTNASNLVFSNVEAYSFNGAFTSNLSAEYYIVLWKNGGTLTATPTDGVTYERGDVVGDARVAYVGSATSFVPRGVIANQSYSFAVYAFSGEAGFENYLTTSPATATVNSTGLEIGSYYAGMNTQSTTFMSDLSALINPHYVVSYVNYKTTLMNQFEVRDTTFGRSFVTCSYSGQKKIFDGTFDWTNEDFSREHTYCHSWMPSFPADDPALAEYSDQHNLYPVNQTQVNAIRGNLPLGTITGTVTSSYLEGKVGYRGTQLVYEPRDSHKGNAARSLMYMVVAYNGQSGNNWKLPDYQEQEDLKAWHFSDAPDNYEIARQEYIYNLQGNRNPFIDSMDYACAIDFSEAVYSYNSCDGAGINTIDKSSIVVFPVPATDMVYIQVNGSEISAYEMLDLNGRSILSVNSTNLSVLELNVGSFEAGTYFIKFSTPEGEGIEKIVVVK